MEESGEDNRVYAANHNAEIHLSVYGGKKASVNISGFYQVGNYSGKSMKGDPYYFSFGPNDSKGSLVTKSAKNQTAHYSGWIKVESASVAADGYVLNESTYASLHGFNNGNWNGRDYMTISALNGKWKVSDGVTQNGTRYFFINIFHTVRINLHHNDGTANKSTMRISTAPDSWSGNAPTDCSWVKPAAAFIPSRNGYSFKGYSTSATGTNLRTDSAGNWKSTKEIVASLSDYYAQWEANTIKLTLNKNGGSGGTDDVWYKYNTNKFYSDSACTNQITSITRPTRAGYTFKGYQGDGTCGGTPNENYIAYSNTEFASDLCSDIYKNATLNAVWEANTIELTLNKNGGSGGTDNVWYKYNTNKFYSDSACTNQITSITRPTRAGYTFKGYQGDGTCGGTPNENYIAYGSTEFASDLCSDIYKNATLNAAWEANTIKLTLNKNGGSGGTDYVWYKYNTNKFYSDSACTNQITSITRPTRAGYTFKGYQGDGTCGGNPNENYIAYDSTEFASDLCSDIYKDATLNAVWTVNNYTVTWNGNGASLDAKLWSYAGSTGYTSSNSGSNSSYTYSGKSALSSVTYDVAISYKTPIPFKLGNTFNGWWTSASGGYMVANTNGQMVASVSGYTDANKKWIRAQATTLYAQWTQQSYSISYNLNGGSLSSQPNSYTFGTAKAIGNPTRTGHTFAGWTVTSTLTNKAYATINLSSGVMEFSNSYPTAVYFPLFYQRANVSYSGKGSDQNGEIRWRQYSTGGAYLGSNSGSSSADCMTSLWYHGGMNSATTTITWSQNAGYTIPSNQTGDLALVARWNVNSYTLTAKANSGSIPATTGWGGTGATATKSVVYDTAYGTLPVPTKTGYGFAGWWTQASGGTQVSATTKMGAADTTIYAHWTINSYTLTADCYGGTAPSTLPGGWTANGQKPYHTLNYQSEYGTLPEPTRQGYIFAGWFTAASGGSEVNSNTTMGAANATIYARWVESWVKYMSNDNPVLDQANGYYKIDSAEKLARLAYLVNYNIDNGKWASYQYKQTADINLSAHYWQPIGNETHPFKGTYDGTTFDIHNMKTYCGVNGYAAYRLLGLFGYTKSAEIQNVNNHDVDMKCGEYSGGIVGRSRAGTIENCKVTGKISGISNFTAGITGESTSTIKDCVNFASVASDRYAVAGIVGDGQGTIENCINYGNISAYEYAAGIIGRLSSGSIKNCVNEGNITCTYHMVGGIVGDISNGSVVSCSNLGIVTGLVYVGGIVGQTASSNNVTISKCLNTGDIVITYTDRTTYAGGILGKAYTSTTIESCFADFKITSTKTITFGTILGYAEYNVTIIYCGARVTTTSNLPATTVYGNKETSVTVTANDWYSLFSINGNKLNRIAATNSGMDGKFGMIPTIHDGLPVPLGIYHTSQYGTTTGIASTLKGSQYGCTTA